MVHSHLRLKINLIVTLIAVFFVVFMWVYNSELVTHDWERALHDIPMFAGIVVAIIAIALIIIYLVLSPLVACLKKIEQGQAVDRSERLYALRRAVHLPIIIIMVNVLGFFIGPIGNMLPRALAGGDNFFTATNILTIIYNVFIGLVCALTIIMLCNVVLAGAKRLINICSQEELEGKSIHDLSMRVKNVLYPFGLALMFAAVIGVAGYSFYVQETSATQALYEKIAQKRILYPAEAEQADNIRRLFMTELATETREKAGTVLILELQQKQARFLHTSSALFLALFIITLGLSFFFSSETSSYLRRFSRNLAKTLSGGGDLSSRLHIVQFNELGDLACLFNRFLEMLHSLIKNVKKSADEVTTSSEILTQFVQNFSHSIGEITDGSRQVEKNTLLQSETVETANHEISDILKSIEEVRENVATQASFIDQSSASIAQMSASINNVAKTTSEAHRMSDMLVTLAKDGEEKVANTILAMEGIDKTSRLVTEIVEVISRIASQTNLLAMNASIEAAHAGVYGKGFAVVADEVKKLAEESAESTQQISAEIEAMAQSITNGVELSQRTGEALGKISSDINHNTKLMNIISQAMEEQNTGTKEIINSMSTIVQATEKIKDRTADQFEKSNTIRGKMDILVSSTADIRTVVDSQATNMSSTLDLIDKLKKVADDNQQTVRELEKTVSQFKV